MGERVDEWIRVLSEAVSRAEPATIDRLAVSELVTLLKELRAAREEITGLRTQLRTVSAEFNGAFSAAEGLQQELAELRELAAGSYTVGWTWRDGELVPDDYVLTDEDGPVDLAVDASGLVRAALERQAAVWVRAAEMTPAVLLEQLLAMVGPGWDLVADSDSERGRRPQYHAGWFRGGAATGRKLEEHHGEGADCASAVRAATIALLRGRRRCETCWNWGREGETGDVRTCLIDPHLLSRSAASSCGGEDWRPARWLRDEPDLPVSPARLVRAALAWAGEIGRLGNLHYTTVERELFAAANELRGIEPEPGDGEGGQ